MAKKLTPEQEKEIAILRANNEMLERTKKETLERGRETAAKRIEIAQQEVLAHVDKVAPGMSQEVKIESEQIVKRGNVNTALNNDYDISEILNANKPQVRQVVKEEEIIEEPEQEEEVTYEYYDNQPIPSSEPTADLSVIANIAPGTQYDIIALPSNGECYRNKIGKVPVAYLTAYDENFITSPNLYKDGLVIDFLLKNKIVGDAINPDDLVSGDADAITLFLRATSYGAEFPIIANDPETGKQVETVVDLTKIKYKEFKLKGDENGYFDYQLPVTKKNVKFRYLTRKQEKDLQTLTKLENYGTRAELVSTGFDSVKNALINDDILSTFEKKDIEKAGKVIDKWVEKLKKKSSNEYNRIITNSLQMQIMEIDGDTNKANIRKFINEMPARDSLMLRKYINDNRPGVDFEVEVERPESQGGGSFTTFLNWDDTVFINIPGL